MASQSITSEKVFSVVESEEQRKQCHPAQVRGQAIRAALITKSETSIRSLST